MAFQSVASNLVPGDTNGVYDVFVYDRQTDSIKRVSVAAAGTRRKWQFGASLDQRRWPLRGVLVYRQQPRPRRYEWRIRRLRHSEPLRRPGSHVVALADGQDVSGIDFGNTSLATKFYVVNDATPNQTYEYAASGGLVESYSLNSGNTAPRGAASTVAGDKTWVVDANRKVYVYNTSGGLLGSWTAGTLNTKATVEGIATNGTDVWIVDAYSDKVYKYANGGRVARLRHQNATSSFNLNSTNTIPRRSSPTGRRSVGGERLALPTRCSSTPLTGSVARQLDHQLAAGAKPTGITIDPANVSNIWIVDSGTESVYQYNAAASIRPPAAVMRPTSPSPWPLATPTRKASPIRRLRAVSWRPRLPFSTSPSRRSSSSW